MNGQVNSLICSRSICLSYWKTYNRYGIGGCQGIGHHESGKSYSHQESWCPGSHPRECRARDWMGFGTVLVRYWDQTWSLCWTGLSLSDPCLEWWKYVHISSPFLGNTLPVPFLPFPSLVRFRFCLTYQGRTFRYSPETAGSLPVLLQDLGPDNPPIS